MSETSRRYELSRRGEEERGSSGACEKQLERRGGLRGKWKPFQCRAWSGLGMGGAFAHIHTHTHTTRRLYSSCRYLGLVQARTQATSRYDYVAGLSVGRGLICWGGGGDKSPSVCVCAGFNAVFGGD